MKVTCCKCHKEYPFVLYESEGVNRPYTVCPHCKFTHLLSFDPVEAPKQPAKEVENLNLTTYEFTLNATRIASATRVDQSLSDDGDVTGWDSDNDFMVAFQISCVKDTGPRSINIEWRDVTDASGWTQLGSGPSAELHYDATTDLVDGQPVTDTTPDERLCTAHGSYGWVDGEEVEGSFQGDWDPTAKEKYTEMHYAISCGTNVEQHEYDFRLWDASEGYEIGIGGASITMGEAAIDLVVADAYHENVVTPATASFLLVVTPTVNDAYSVLEDDGPLALTVHLDVNDAYNVLEDDGPLTITHIIPVVPNDAYHDNVVTPATASFLLQVTPTVNDAFSVLEDPGPLALGVHLTVASGSSDLLDDGPITITEKKTLSVNSAYHETQDGGPLTLTEKITLVVEDCFSLAEDVGPISLTEINILTCADCNHDLIDPGPITLTVEGAVDLVVADAFHLTEDPGPLALTVHLAVADSGHDVESPQINITSGQNLVVADAFHVLEDTGPVSLTQKHNLTVADAFHVLEDPGPLALTQKHNLTISDCENAVESPELALVSGLQLAVSSAYHEHLPSAIGLTQKHDLALNSAYHQHDLEGDLILTTTGPVELVVAACEHTLTDDLSAITQLHILTVDSCEDAVVSAQITITHVLPSALGDIVDPSIRSLTTDRFLVSLTTERTIHHS